MASLPWQVPPVPPIPPVPPVPSIPPVPPMPIELQVPPLPPEMMIPHGAVELVQSFFFTVAVIVLGYPLIRALTRRFLERPPAAPPLSGDVTVRLERIEQAVEAIAIEVERVSEAQRFQTKLMTESRALPGGSGGEAASGSRGRDSAR